MITTSGGGALICPDEEAKKKIMFYATQARESYPYYQHEKIGYNYRMSNICAGIGRGQMTVLNEHIAHHRYICQLYKEQLAGVDGIVLHENPSSHFDSNYWLNTILLDPDVHVKGEEHAYETAIQGAVGGAARSDPHSFFPTYRLRAEPERGRYAHGLGCCRYRVTPAMETDALATGLQEQSSLRERYE